MLLQHKHWHNHNWPYIAINLHLPWFAALWAVRDRSVCLTGSKPGQTYVGSRNLKLSQSAAATGNCQLALPNGGAGFAASLRPLGFSFGQADNETYS